MITGEQLLPDPYQLMKDRVAFVTGGSRGIGAATAMLLGRYGARVGVNYYQNEAAAQKVVSTIEQAGGKALAVQADVANAEQVEAMVQHVREVLGPIDTLVLNAPAASSLPHASNTLSPSERFQAVLAPLTPLRRNGRPEDVAAAIVYLASNQASFVTGAYLTVDGGNLIM